MAQKEWCDLLTDNTKGRIKCNILPRGVTPAPGTYDAIKNGLADLSYTVHGYTPGRFVMTQMSELPFLGNSAETISVALSRVTGKHPEFAAEHQGVKVITLFWPRHCVQHQARHCQDRRPERFEVPRWRRHGQ
jgi:TRAP-type C4-dicarboxylate transport system substrate-binding protein